MIAMFAIPNCDTVKKARYFLENNNVSYNFIDFKKTPPTKAQITMWGAYFDELPVNKKGTTYRKFKEHYETLNLTEKIDFICLNPSLLKRPILIRNDQVIAIGFSEANYSQLLENNSLT